MGYGNYSHSAHEALLAGRTSASRESVFTQRHTHALMSPKGLKVRESRDSPDHPNSLPIIFALDVTGSMGGIPHELATKELPRFMKLLEHCKVPDAQLLFMAIGDGYSDQAPLQIGQFETTAELMDQWLTRCYLEGGGGGTGEESYELAFYVAAQHTDTDAYLKRRKKGYLFITGDELPYNSVSRAQIDSFIGQQLTEDVPIEEAIAAASEMYHCFYLIPDRARAQRCEARWRELLGDHVIVLENSDDTCAVAAAIVALTEGSVAGEDALAPILKPELAHPERLGSVMRAVGHYAAALDPNHSSKLHQPQGKTAISAWWKKLFD
jgi:hypothetical protein